MAIDELTPFLTFSDSDPDMSEGEITAECDRLFQRQKAIASLIDGDLPADVLLDMLAEDGIDPIAWADVAIDNMTFLMSQCG